MDWNSTSGIFPFFTRTVGWNITLTYAVVTRIGITLGKKRVSFSWLLAFVPLIPLLQGDEEKEHQPIINQLVEKAIELQNNGDYDGAEAIYMELIKTYSHFPHLQMVFAESLAHLYHLRKQQNKRVDDCSKRYSYNLIHMIIRSGSRGGYIKMYENYRVANGFFTNSNIVDQLLE